jgi:OCT family organic cation transporter-like MFS transporter 18
MVTTTPPAVPPLQLAPLLPTVDGIELMPMRETRRNNRDLVLWITYINIVLYALCYQLQRPVEPFLVKSLTENHDDPKYVSEKYSQLQSFFSAIQTVGSPLVGILLDRVGVRKASCLVFLASALSYAILASATNMNLLFLSKVPTALQHAFLVAQAAAAISTGSNAAARAQALGRMTTAYTIGGTIGPALGGWLVDTMGDLYLGAKLAVFGSLISVVLSVAFLPDEHVPDSSAPVKKNRSFLGELQNTYNIAMRPNLWPLLLVKIVGGFASSMHSTALPLVLTQTLNFEPSQLGLTMSTAMFAVAAFGAFAMAPLTKILGLSSMGYTGLLMRAALVQVLAIIIATAVGNDRNVVMRVVASSILHALASHVLATALTTQTTGAVHKTEQGALLGLEHGLFSLARVGAPPTASYLLTTSGFYAVALSCGAVDVALVGLLVATAAQTQLKPVPMKADLEHSD